MLHVILYNIQGEDMKENLFVTALKQHFLSQRQEAIAVLSLYLSNPVAIGDHPDILKILIEYTEKIAHADDCLETLDKYLTQGE